MPFNQNKIEQGIDVFPVIYTEHGLAAPEDVPEVLLGRPGGLPEGVYDTVLAKNGRVYDWGYHWKRFEESCSDRGLAVPGFLSDVTIANWVQQLSEERVQSRITSFREEQFLRSGVRFRMMVLMRAIAGNDATRGMRCAIAPARRRSDDFSYHHKLTGRIEEERTLDDARAQGYGDVLFLNDREEICEGAYSNVVLVNDGVLYVPGSETACLPGVTVRVLLEKAERAGVAVVKGAIGADELGHAEEVWLTSSLRGVQWVSEVGLFTGAERASEESVYSRLVLDSGR